MHNKTPSLQKLFIQRNEGRLWFGSAACEVCIEIYNIVMCNSHLDFSKSMKIYHEFIHLTVTY